MATKADRFAENRIKIPTRCWLMPVESQIVHFSEMKIISHNTIFIFLSAIFCDSYEGLIVLLKY